MTDLADAAAPRLTVTPHGPYLDATPGACRIRRRRQVTSELGEPMTWERPRTVPDPADGRAVPLRRLGEQAVLRRHARPHRLRRDRGRADHDLRRARVEAYEGRGVVVRDDRGHLRARRVLRQPADQRVGDGSRRRDVPTPSCRAQMMAMIERCPSGAPDVPPRPATAPDIEPDLPITDRRRRRRPAVRHRWPAGPAGRRQPFEEPQPA